MTKKFYITTPIYYVTANPHIGTAFTNIIADILARWHRLNNENVFFLTGTDEHGQKVAEKAKLQGKEPKEFVDEVSQKFKDAWSALDISYDKFIRTTDKEHEEVVLKFIDKLNASGDIYKGKYSGWYCVPDETFITEKELIDGKCPECKRPVIKFEEDAYYFRLSKYQDKLLKLYTDNPDFLLPHEKAGEIINRVKEGLNDLDITRKTITWGIPFPLDKQFVAYVWVDALLNYISALGWPNGDKFNEFWPADVQVMGKEITWFHAVIWPALLMSTGTELPKSILSHGWWTVEGQKMSKSLGNVVDAVEVSKKYSVDAVRFFVIREKALHKDGDFSEKALITRINGELVADLGNLASRVLTLAEKFDGKVQGKDELSKNLDMAAIRKHFDTYDTFAALEEVWKFVRSTNKYINEKKVWELKGDELSNALYNLLESLRIISILINPFMPSTSARLCEQLGVKLGNADDCKFGEFTGKAKKGEYLFKKVE